MLEQLDCIALRTVKYNDRNSILAAYTRQHGRLSLLIPAGTSREAKRIRAICQPMGSFSCVADIRPNRDIYRISDIKANNLLNTSAAAPFRAPLTLFIADFLSALLREPQQDSHLFSFLSATARNLATLPAPAAANFHIAFLIHLQHFLGIEPDWSTFSPGYVFDLADGIFRPSPPLHNRFLPSAEAQIAHTLRRINIRTAPLFRFSRADRNNILDRLIQYYSIHFPGVGSTSSLGILRTLFDF